MTFAAAALAAAMTAPAAAMPASAPIPSFEGRPSMPVILDAGHGGDDLGAVVHGIKEKDIALAVTRLLRDKLKNVFPVMLTREDDEYVTLDRRVVNGVDWNGAAFVSIHLNEVRSKTLSGAVVYSYGPDKNHLARRHRRHRLVPPMPAPPRVDAREGEFLAQAIEKSLREGGIRAERDKADYYVLKNPAQPSVLVEIGFLSNPAEAARLNDPAYQDKLASALAKAISGFASERALRAGATALAAPGPSHF